MEGSTPRSRWREAWIGFFLVLISIVVSVLTAELALRTFGSDEKRWEFRNFLRESTATGRWRGIVEWDSQLGYVPRSGYSGRDQLGAALLSFDENRLRVHRRGDPRPAKESPPILVVGNSYAMGEEVSDDETFPAHLQALLDRRVLNGGVLGYGMDQIVLRAEQLVAAFDPDILLVSVIADDVRRTENRVLWGIDKPYFDVVGDALVLRNVPVPRTMARAPLGIARRVLGYSFLVDVGIRRLGLEGWWLRGTPLHVERAHDQGAQVSCLLMNRLRQLGNQYGLRVLVVAIYTPQAWLRVSTRGFEEEIIGNLLECARKSGIETLDTGKDFEAAVQAGGVGRYYINRHTNNEGNRLAAVLSAKHL
jgi:hypothetical protein